MDNSQQNDVENDKAIKSPTKPRKERCVFQGRPTRCRASSIGLIKSLESIVQDSRVGTDTNFLTFQIPGPNPKRENISLYAQLISRIKIRYHFILCLSVYHFPLVVKWIWSRFFCAAACVRGGRWSCRRARFVRCFLQPSPLAHCSPR